jgi:DNA-binding LytR/AlgR family response regulator
MTRGRRSYVDLEDIDWIETQGNYLALHVNSSTHMIRATLTNFEAQLDARRFVRIHRRLIVAVDRIRDLRPAGNGDAIVQLVDGRELSASRRYRKIIGQRWPHPAR